MTTSPDQITIRIKKRGCKTKCQWAWAVLRDGSLIAHGDCDTNADARREAEEIARELRDGIS